MVSDDHYSETKWAEHKKLVCREWRTAFQLLQLAAKNEECIVAAGIQRLRTEKNQIFQPVKKDTDKLQAVMNMVGEAGDVIHLSQNVVETFIDRIEVFNNERVKIHFTFEDVLKSYEAE